MCKRCDNHYTIHSVEELKKCSNFDCYPIKEDKRFLLDVWFERKYFDTLIYLEGLNWLGFNLEYLEGLSELKEKEVADL